MGIHTCINVSLNRPAIRIIVNLTASNHRIYSLCEQAAFMNLLVWINMHGLETLNLVEFEGIRIKQDMGLGDRKRRVHMP